MRSTPIDRLEADGIVFYKGSAGGEVIKRAVDLSHSKKAVNAAVFFVLVSSVYLGQPSQAHGKDRVRQQTIEQSSPTMVVRGLDEAGKRELPKVVYSHDEVGREMQIEKVKRPAMGGIR